MEGYLYHHTLHKYAILAILVPVYGGMVNYVEKVIEENNETAFSMEVDDQNEENMKEKEHDKEKVSYKEGNEKEGNENEGNDNMNKNEINNDALQKEQQVETKKEKEAEIKKKQEKVDDTSDILSRDGFKPTVRTNPGMEPVLESEFTSKNNKEKFVFETKRGAVTIRDNVHTLAPQLKVEANVIDSFAAIDGEQQRNKNEAFLSHRNDYMLEWKKDDGKEDEDKQYEAFCKTMDIEFHNGADLSKNGTYRNDKMSEEAHAFAKKHIDKKLKKNFIIGQINKKKQEQDSDRVQSTI
ncbi:hypothetical protein Tco_0802759 [Tanacetum coccineum]|uniref:Uncharacterized protein n=1 Tax=Tanacetum coccineum TaxID=301880 RepID=A0ABQ5A2E9_9ASTR